MDSDENEFVDSDHGNESKAYASIPKSTDDYDSDSDGIPGRDYHAMYANNYSYQRGTKTNGLDSDDAIIDLFDSGDYETNSYCSAKQPAFKRLSKLTSLDVEAKRYVISTKFLHKNNFLSCSYINLCYQYSEESLEKMNAFVNGR